mmetsp:Transcript_9828/g.29697  ORF Transcript_9828/g.29697 Transcript_9828/m.29697 type:complete len:592 (+) Transcript_9828:41-1816(+)
MPGDDQKGQDEEKQMRKDFERFEGDVATLPPADQLMMGLMDREPETRVLLRAFTLRDEFAETVENLEDSVRIVHNACDNLVNSLALPLMLRFILNVGNKLNTNSSRLRNAEGITLESLQALQGVETNIKGKKFMHWVAERMEHANVNEEVERLKDAIDTVVSVVDLQQLVKEEHQLSTSLTKTKSATETTNFCTEFSEFFEKAHEIYDGFHHEYEELCEVMEKTKSLFVEDDVEEVFRHVLNFLSFYLHCVEQNQARIAKEEKRKKMAAARGALRASVAADFGINSDSSVVSSGDETPTDGERSGLFASIRGGRFLKSRKKHKLTQAAQDVLDHVEVGKQIYSAPERSVSQIPSLPSKAALKASCGRDNFVAPAVTHDNGDALQNAFMKRVQSRKTEDDDSQEEDDEDWDAPPTAEDAVKAVPKWKRDMIARQEAEEAAARQEAEDAAAELAGKLAKEAKAAKDVKKHGTKGVQSPRSERKKGKIPVSFVPKLPGKSNVQEFKGKLSKDEAKYISVGDACVCIGIGGNKNVHGTVRYYGKTYFARGTWVGVELSEKIGKNNGSVNGIEYFSCRPKRGVFVRPQRVKRIRNS